MGCLPTNLIFTVLIQRGGLFVLGCHTVENSIRQGCIISINLMLMSSFYFRDESIVPADYGVGIRLPSFARSHFHKGSKGADRVGFL